ncbi:hypothetical protein PS15p_208290 [Mucor circinelloides]
MHRQTEYCMSSTSRLSKAKITVIRKDANQALYDEANWDWDSENETLDADGDANCGRLGYKREDVASNETDDGSDNDDHDGDDELFGSFTNAKRTIVELVTAAKLK